MRNCIVCGESIPEDAHTNTKRCSEKCVRLARSRHPYSKARNAGRGTAQRIAKAVLQEQGHKCAVCKWSLGPDGEGLEVHHITATADGGTHDRENLIALCPNHHKEADRGLFSIEGLQEYRLQAARGNAEAMMKRWDQMKAAIARLDAQRLATRGSQRRRHKVG